MEQFQFLLLNSQVFGYIGVCWKVGICVKANGVRVSKKLLNPGEKISIAKKTYTIEYQPPAGQRAQQVLEDREEEDVLSQSLLERAGLAKPGPAERRPPGKTKADEP